MTDLHRNAMESVELCTNERLAAELARDNQTRATADATRMCGEQRERAEKAEARLAAVETDRSSVGYKLEGENEALKASRERAWSLLKELGVSVMP